MRIGRRTQFWRRNCVAIGLASGFVEPLESTGIHLILHTIMALLDYFPDRSMNPALQSVFNTRIGQTYEDIRDFIMLHYLLAQRSEPFWQDARRVPLPDSLAAVLALYDECGQFVRNQAHVFPAGIATRIEPGREFYPAEAYHQDYLTRNPTNRYIAVNDLPKIEDLKRLFPELYRAAPVLVAASQPSN